MAEHIRFEEGLIGDGFSYAFGISTVDLTGNGFPDIVAMDTDVGLYWFENDGSGRFTRHVIHERAGEWLERHEIADIDGDGRPEIVSVDNKGGSLLWFEFDGDPRERRSWTHHYITDGGFPGAYDLAVADLDGDGHLDVAATNWRIGNEVAWFENRGTGGSSTPSRRASASRAPSWPSTSTATAAWTCWDRQSRAIRSAGTRILGIRRADRGRSTSSTPHRNPRTANLWT